MSLILCRQEPVRHPFYIERLGIHIASSQELCYVIYQNPLLVLDGFVDDRLILFQIFAVNSSVSDLTRQSSRIRL